YDILPQNARDFDMAGTHGREFQVGTFNGQCAGEAWMYISTQDHCQHESGGTFPRFFYSLSPSSTPLGISTFGEGDVFAILADGGDIRCGSAFTAEPFTSRSEYCVYNDNIYEQGDTWVDGCQYNCTCSDASTGRYQCVNRCPVYTNMPQGCLLVDVPGECCPRLDCLSTDPGCYFKNVIYHEGVTWQDGCDYDCTCTNGATGTYHCTTICQTWDLPSSCTMSPPPPGKCCEVPNCPPNIIIENPNPR
ncbi:hypothetical protein MQA30_25450, partial [Escherichia coli]|nr:hypothetical protein [Escherichia coli]